MSLFHVGNISYEATTQKNPLFGNIFYEAIRAIIWPGLIQIISYNYHKS